MNLVPSLITVAICFRFPGGREKAARLSAFAQARWDRASVISHPSAPTWLQALVPNSANPAHGWSGAILAETQSVRKASPDAQNW